MTTAPSQLRRPRSRATKLAWRAAPRAPLEVAVVGLGAWGLCVLERLVAAARASGTGTTRVHVIEPGPPGVGVYALDQPDYFLLNTPCGQISLYPWTDQPRVPAYGISLHQWVMARGYRWVGERCLRGQGGREPTADDFLPRRVLGEYLEWFFHRLAADAGPHTEIVLHRTRAVDIASAGNGHERILLANGEVLRVEHVVITVGHAANAAPPASVAGSRLVSPYPVEGYASRVMPGATIAVAGMGLVAIDVVAALTSGRGGSFSGDGDRLRYTPSGREPQIHLYSRGGLPHCAKAMGIPDATDSYELGIWNLKSRGGQGAGAPGDGRATPLDARRDLMPLIYGEMQLCYYSQSVRLALGGAAAESTRSSLIRAWAEGRFEAELARLAPRFGRFEPAEHFFPDLESGFASGEDYESYVYDRVAADLDEALRPPGTSPVKAAYEVLRFLRDPMRNAVEFGGLTADSHLDFFSQIRGRVTRLVAGPPAVRSQQLLALMDAGVVRMPLGPAPMVTQAPEALLELRATHLAEPFSEVVPLLIRGYLEDPTVHRSESELLRSLYHRGRVQQLDIGGRPVGSIALTTNFHPVGADGKPEANLWVFGAVTEGARYFTHYIPSPRSRLRAFQDAQACAELIFA